MPVQEQSAPKHAVPQGHVWPTAHRVEDAALLSASPDEVVFAGGKL